MAMAKKVLGAVFKKSTGEGLSTKLIPYHFTHKAAAGIVAGGVIATSAPELFKAGERNKMGPTSMDQLDRLISYDGMGYAENVNRISRGDPEVEADITKNVFNNVNQFGADGNIVFALHNLREG